MKAGICIVQFPGVNCEYETARAVEAAGMAAAVVRWNRLDADLSGFDGFVLPGGFSYEDRVRAGAIAAGEDIMAGLMEEAGTGKPVVGICNGAQVLVECGLVPGSAGSGNTPFIVVRPDASFPSETPDQRSFPFPSRTESRTRPDCAAGPQAVHPAARRPVEDYLAARSMP